MAANLPPAQEPIMVKEIIIKFKGMKYGTCIDVLRLKPQSASPPLDITIGIALSLR